MPRRRPYLIDLGFTISFGTARRIKSAVVYGIVDGATGLLVYVGRTKKLSKRLERYTPQDCHNAFLREWLKEHSARIVIFSNQNCPDVEARLIRKYNAQLFNLSMGHEERWRAHKRYPWMVGTGIKCPSDHLIIHLRSRGRRNSPRLDAVKSIRSKMDVRARCLFEVGLAREYYDTAFGEKFERWLTLATPKLIAALEEPHASSQG